MVIFFTYYYVLSRFFCIGVDVWKFLFEFLIRTLLALECHVAQVNVHAEDDLKKIKLPKE